MNIRKNLASAAAAFIVALPRIALAQLATPVSGDSIATPGVVGTGQSNATPSTNGDDRHDRNDDSHAIKESQQRDRQEQELEAIVISAKFVNSGAYSAMKQNLDVRDTPYSVADYSNSFMKAIETANLTDLYSYMTGVSRGGVTGYDISIRGFKTTQSDENAILIDGLPGLAGRFGSPPTVMADHIEVVKGPASVLYGEAQPGGFVNIVTKKPQDTAAGFIDVLSSGFAGDGLSPGNANSFTGDIDVTGPIDANHRFLYRLVGEQGKVDTFRGGWERATYLAPSLTWNVSSTTVATLAAEYRKRSNAYDNLLVAPNKDANLIAPITTKYQEPGDVQFEEGQSTTLAVRHDFENRAIWNFSVRNVRGLDTASGYDNVAVLANLETLQRRARQQENHRGYDYFDTNFSVPFNTGFVGHKFLAGASGGINTTDFNRIQFYNGATTGSLAKPGPLSLNIDIYDPIYGVSPPLSAFPAGTVNDRRTKETNAGVYLSDALTFSDHWKASLGLRYTHDAQNSREVKTPPLTSQNKAASDVLPTAGIMYEPTRHLTFYYSYATSFVAASPTAQDATGNNPFTPTTAKQNEVGTKANVWDDKVSTTLALYDIKKTNTLAVAICDTGVGGVCSQQVGGEESKGVEWEIDARPVDNWQILFGLAHDHATIDASNGAKTSPLAGSRLTNAPINSAHVWSRYDLTEGALRQFGLGLGVSYVGDQAGSQPSLSDPRVLLLPSHVVTDLALYYTPSNKLALTFKVGNLFNKTYFEGVNSTTNDIGVVPGSPRSIELAVRAGFL
jgi:iron complex outermembrane receptor protein